MNRFAVIGLGSFGAGLARVLARLGAHVIAIDNDAANVQKLMDFVHTAVRMDARDRAALEEQGIHEVDCAVICMGEDFEAAEITAVHLAELGCARVLVRGTSRERVEILSALDLTVITPALEAAREQAVRLMSPGLADYNSFAGEHDVALARVPSSLAGETLGALELEEKYHVKAMALRRGEESRSEVQTGMGSSCVLRGGDHLFLVGLEKDLIRAGRVFEEP